MPVDTTHADYKGHEEIWAKCRCATDGEDAVKRKKAIYLPMLDKQTVSDYHSYLMRAMFYEATGRTVLGLLGAVFRKKYTIEPEEEAEKIPGLDELVSTAVEEVIIAGRIGIFVESTDGGEPYFALYKAEDIVNWRYHREAGQVVLDMVVLRESVMKQRADDDFEFEKKRRYRVLKLVEGVFTVETFEEKAGTTAEYISTGTVTPTERGATMNKIPFVFIGSTVNSPDVVNPPILGLVNVNLSHYRNSADLEHGRHFTGLPTAWVAGFEHKQGELTIGSSEAWISNNPQARAGYLEFTGSGLSTLENALAAKEHLMAILGARLLEGQRTGVEAAETARIRQAGENATLTSIVENVERGLTKALQLYADRRVRGGTEIRISLNRDFIDTRMGPAELSALVAAWQAGALSDETLLWNIKQGEILPKDVSVDDEIGRIETSTLKPELPALDNGAPTGE